MLELIYYGLFLLLYGFGAWRFFNGLHDYTNASIASKPQPSASQFDIGNMNHAVKIGLDKHQQNNRIFTSKLQMD